MQKQISTFVVMTLMLVPAAQAFAPRQNDLETNHDLRPPPPVRRAQTALSQGMPGMLEDDGAVVIGHMKIAMPPQGPNADEDPTVARMKHYIREVEGNADLVFLDMEILGDGNNRVFSLVQALTESDVADGVPILGTFALAQIEGEDTLRHLRYQVTDPPQLSVKASLDANQANYLARKDAAKFAQAASSVPPKPLLAVQYIDSVPKLIWLVYISTEGPWAKWAYSIDAKDGTILSRTVASLDGVSGILTGNIEPSCQGDTPVTTPLPFTQWTNGFATNADGKFRGLQNLTVARVALNGVYFTVKNYGSDTAAATYPIKPDPATNEVFFDRAPLSQIDPYIYATQVRRWLTARAATIPEISARPRLKSWTNAQFPIKTNLPGGYRGFSCNAFYDGLSINFYDGDARRGCNNSGRAAKIVYHEYGHGIHDHLTANRYTFNPQVSEGVSDYVMGTMTNEPNVTGLFGCKQTLPGRTTVRTCANRYTYCSSGRCNSRPGDEPHNAAPIICGALWEIRAAMKQKYGDSNGTLKADQFFLRFLTIVTDMNSSYAAAIAADEDDDNNPSNGTKHSCIINKAFIGASNGDFAHFPDSVRLRVPCKNP